MKKPNVLVTPTLLNSFEFAKNAPPSWVTRAMNDFIGKIRREKSTFPAWVGKGIAFEDTVYRVCNKAQKDGVTNITQGSDHFQHVANQCLGGSFQDVYKKTIIIDDMLVLYYNKTDVVFPDKIIDIKTTLKWKGADKYLKGWQHMLYLWASGLSEFEYLVAVWQNEWSDKIASVHTVKYTLPDASLIEQKIIEATKEMFDFLKANGLYEDYYSTFSYNKR